MTATVTYIHPTPQAAWLAQARLIARDTLHSEAVPYGPTLVAALNVLGRSNSDGDQELRGQVLRRIAADSLSGLENAGATGGEAA